MEPIKEEARRIINSLPDNATWEDIIYKMYVCQKIEKAEKFVEEGGKTHSLEDVKKRLFKK